MPAGFTTAGKRDVHTSDHPAPPPLFLLQPIIPHPFLHSLYEQLHLDSDPLDIFSRISIAFAQRLENSHRTFVGLGMFCSPPPSHFLILSDMEDSFVDTYIIHRLGCDAYRLAGLASVVVYAGIEVYTCAVCFFLLVSLKRS